MTAPHRVPLPDGALLLHIGPHKTGTTAVQSAFHRARADLRAQRVHYAGPDRHAVTAAQAVIEAARPDGRRTRPIASWRRLVAEVRKSTADRVVVSSEFYADAAPEAIRRIVDDLEPRRLHVVLVARPLVPLLPSQWQQYVKAGLTVSFTDWLESIFSGTGDRVSPTFWHRHRHDRLAARWADVVGLDHVTVIVPDEADHGSILRRFEELLDLRDGTLVPEEGRRNRSLTLPEVELVRAFNVPLGREVADSNLRLNLGLYGAAAALEASRPDPADPRIEVPAWAVERASDVQREIVQGIGASGVRIIGNLQAFVDMPPVAPASKRGVRLEPWSTWPRLAAVAGVGVLSATGLARAGRAADPRVAAALVRPLSTVRLRRVVVQRWRDQLRLFLGRRGRPSGATAQRSPRERELTKAETVMLERFVEELRAAGIPDALYGRVLHDGLSVELLGRREAMPGEAPSAVLGATLAFGVVRASGLVGGGGRTRPAPRALVETSEVARVPTATLVRIIVGRVLRDRAGILGR